MRSVRPLTLETVNFDNEKEVDTFLDQVIGDGMRSVHAGIAELQAKGPHRRQR